MRILPIATVTAALVLAGCKPDAPKLPTMPAAFATLPLPPDPEFIGQSGSEDALMFTFRSATASDTITKYYQFLFAHDTTYHVMSSNPGGAGEHAFYVEYKGRPLWIRIRPEAGNEGSIVELTGAVVPSADSTKHDTTAAHATAPKPAPATTAKPKPAPRH